MVGKGTSQAVMPTSLRFAVPVPSLQNFPQRLPPVGADTRQAQRATPLSLCARSLGMWRGRVVFLVWTPREDNSAHLISCRYADRKQTGVYFSSL